MYRAPTGGGGRGMNKISASNHPRFLAQHLKIMPDFGGYWENRPVRIAAPNKLSNTARSPRELPVRGSTEGLAMRLI